MTLRQLGDYLGVVDLILITPIVIFVAWRLWQKAKKRPLLKVLRERALNQRVLAVIVTVFSLIFWSNDMPRPLLDPDMTRIITRSTIALAVVSAYWLWLYRKRKRAATDLPSPLPSNQASLVSERSSLPVKVFGREPTLWLAVIYAVLTVVGTSGLANFSGDQANLTNAAIAALVGAVNAYAVRPISPVSFTYAVAALAQLGAAYGVALPEETLLAINGLVVPALALLSRGQVAPADTAISRSTTGDEKAVAEPGTGEAPTATVA